MLEILHRADVNIASMNVARSIKPTSSSASATGAAEEVPMALCFMALDDDVSTNAMSALLSLNFLHDVAKIQLQ